MASQALCEYPSTSQVSSQQDRRVCESVEENRDRVLVAEPSRDLERLLPPLFGQIRATERVLHASLDPQRPRDQPLGHVRISGKKGCCPVRALVRAVGLPVALEHDDELEAELALVRLERPGERRPHVVALGDDELVAWRPLRLDDEVRRPREGEVVLCVAAPNCVGLLLRPELLGGELADRLEHEVAGPRVPPPDVAGSCRAATGASPGSRHRRPRPPRSAPARED